MLKSNVCPDCNTKLRKFRDGYICQKNHKIMKDTNMYNEITFKEKEVKFSNTNLCPMCQTEMVEMEKCPNGKKYCGNNHAWTSQYYEDNDTKYLWDLNNV